MNRPKYSRSDIADIKRRADRVGMMLAAAFAWEQDWPMVDIVRKMFKAYPIPALPFAFKLRPPLPFKRSDPDTCTEAYKAILELLPYIQKDRQKAWLKLAIVIRAKTRARIAELTRVRLGLDPHH